MKTGQKYEDSRLAMAHSHDIRCHYIAIGDLTQEVGPQMAAVAAQILCLAFRRTAIVVRNGAGRIEHEIDPAIIGAPRRSDRRGKND